MSRPSRATTAGQVYLDLQARARREKRPTDELFVLYVLERFLYRLSISPHRHRLVLKGGMLLAALGPRRPTRDVDLLARAVDNDAGTISALIRELLAITVDDGVVYEPDRMTTTVIREQDPYAGARISVPARLDRARPTLRVDVNVGDPVTPEPIEVPYPALLGEPFMVTAYPIETVLAEKIVTMIDRGDATTRERDFADVALLIGEQEVDAASLRAAIEATAAHRQSTLQPLAEVLVALPAMRQADWHRFVTQSGLADRVPETYQELIEVVARFADPILTGAVFEGRWLPPAGAWRAG